MASIQRCTLVLAITCLCAGVALGVHVPPVATPAGQCESMADNCEEVNEAVGTGGSPMAWAIIASFPLGCLLIALLCGCFRCESRETQQTASTLETCEECFSNQVETVTEVADEVLEKDDAGERDLIHGADLDASGAVSGSHVTLTLPKVIKRKDAYELKIWMEKQRGQCEVVAENTQALIVTDAKHDDVHSEVVAAPDNAEPRHVDEACALDAAPRGQRAKRRSASELKAWMERKRDECHVLESAQEHIETDAKATKSHLTCTPEMGVLSSPNKENMTDAAQQHVRIDGHKGRTSNKQLHEWMSQKRDQCEVLGSTTE